LVTTTALRDNHPKALSVKLTPWPKYGDPSICLSCRILAAPADERKWLCDEYLPLAEAARDAGVPTGIPIWPLYGSADDINGPQAWRGFRLRTLAVQVHGLPGDLDEVGNTPMFRLADREGGQSWGFVVYETAVYHEHINASLIFRSDPERGETRLEVRNWQRVERLSDLQRLMRGAEIFKALTRGGRPLGGTTWTKEEFLFELPRARQKLRTRNGRKPTGSEIAAEMGISSPTFYRYKRQCLRDPE
jgi:hypothetical protein